MATGQKTKMVTVHKPISEVPGASQKVRMPLNMTFTTGMQAKPFNNKRCFHSNVPSVNPLTLRKGGI